MNSPAEAGPDTGRCPLCGEPNACAMEEQRRTGETQPPCWCVQMKFEPSLLARLPPGAVGVACICSRCAGAPPASR
jgi:hypothetical protein